MNTDKLDKEIEENIHKEKYYIVGGKIVDYDYVIKKALEFNVVETQQ